ncbi:hypothetical protein Dxin01_03197 [Deinococcus xinjiangensis]|uniref:Uncharacterized protein n=1 Tax=Deinococcus xinjiangensis TaxID=457454 RepID=A0ABP9VDX3_9DEIO
MLVKNLVAFTFCKDHQMQSLMICQTLREDGIDAATSQTTEN